MPPLHDPDVWLFDLDNTLYPARCNLFAQIDVRIGRYISDWLKVTPEEARVVQKAYWRDHGTSMRGMMSLHGVDPTHYLDYVHDIDYSGLPHLPELATQISKLPGRRLIFTNGSRRHAEKVASKLGVRHLFEDICDIQALAFVPKPERAAFDKMIALHNINATRAAMFEDMPQNLISPHDMGMTTVLVKSNYVDHPVQIEMRKWHELPAHVHHMTEDLQGFLGGVVLAG